MTRRKVQSPSLRVQNSQPPPPLSSYFRYPSSIVFMKTACLCHLLEMFAIEAYIHLKKVHSPPFQSLKRIHSPTPWFNNPLFSIPVLNGRPLSKCFHSLGTFFDKYFHKGNSWSLSECVKVFVSNSTYFQEKNNIIIC